MSGGAVVARPDHRQLPLLLDVPARVPGRPRHAARDAHAARLGAADRQRDARRQPRGTPRPSTRCTTAPTAAAASRIARPTSRCPRRSSGPAPAWPTAGPGAGGRPRGARRGSSGGAASTATRARAPRPPTARSGCSSATRAGGRDADASTRRSACWRAPASRAVIGRRRPIDRPRRQLARLRRHGQDAGRAPCWPTSPRSTCTQLLVLGPGDRFAFERAYATRLGVTWPEGVRVREVDRRAGRSARQRHAALPGAGRRRSRGPTRNPTTPSAVGERPWPRQLLAAALGDAYERRPLRRDERAHPCGTAGGLDLTQPALAAGLADARIADATAAGAARLVTEDPACVRHLRAARGRPARSGRPLRTARQPACEASRQHRPAP